MCYYIICTYFFFSFFFPRCVFRVGEKYTYTVSVWHCRDIYIYMYIFLANMFIVYTRHTTSCAYINCGLLGFGDLRMYIYCTPTTVIDTKCAIIQSRLLRPNVKVTAGPVCLDSRTFSNNKNRLHLSKNLPPAVYSSVRGDNDRYIECTHIYLA